jgi:hypothetical protein
MLNAIITAPFQKLRKNSSNNKEEKSEGNSSDDLSSGDEEVRVITYLVKIQSKCSQSLCFFWYVPVNTRPFVNPLSAAGF